MLCHKWVPCSLPVLNATPSGVPNIHQGSGQAGGFSLSFKVQNKAWGAWRWLGSPGPPEECSVYPRLPACL